MRMIVLGLSVVFLCAFGAGCEKPAGPDTSNSARSDIERIKAEAEKAKAEAERAKAEAEAAKAGAETERLGIQAQKAEAETAKASAEAERLRIEAHKPKPIDAAVFQSAVQSVVTRSVTQELLLAIHPLGENVSLTRVSVAPLGSGVEVNLGISWTGGVLKRPYNTTISWRFNRTDHLGSNIEADSALTPISAEKKNRLDSLLRGLVPQVISKLKE